MIQKPFSEACENNKQPILDVLDKAFRECRCVLEIGSGTGQHAVYFASQLPHLVWQPSDQAANLNGIRSWIAEHPSPNLRAPVALNVRDNIWPAGTFDAVFSANTAHIMSWETAQLMITKVGHLLPVQGVFALYGPFNYSGQFTSDSNASFDRYLRESDPKQGLRNFEDIDRTATAAGLILQQDHALPANNRCLVWQKSG